MPHALRAVDRDSEVPAALKVLSGFDADLTPRMHQGDQPPAVPAAADFSRPWSGSSPEPCCGSLTLHPATRQVTRDGQVISLTAREFGLLEYLMRHPREVLSKAQILDNVWDPEFPGGDNVVEVYIGYLRRKIDEPFGVHTLRTVRGMGYRLSPD
jgi:DNA-binding response OmpR family regulator